MANQSLTRHEEDRANFYLLPLNDLCIIYPSRPNETSYKHRNRLNAVKRQVTKSIQTGKKPMPQNPEYENPETERERASARRRRIAPQTGQVATSKLVTIQVLEEHARYHEQLKKALEEQGHLSKARFSDYQMGMKNADGEFESHDLKAARFEVKFDSEPQWYPITPITLEKPLRRTYEKAKNPTDWQTTLVIPDVQYPCGDEKALAVLLNIARTIKPDNFVQLGDLLDLTAHGRFIDSKGAEFADNTMEATTDALKLFREIRLISPSARIVYLEGNHERRLPKDVLSNHTHNFRIKPADDPEGHPLISVPRMVGLDSVDVEYLPGYPNNRYWINDNLQIIHGSITGRNENKRVNFSERVSTIHGHTHRLGTDRQTINFRDGGAYRQVFNAGTMSRIDRTVPGTNTGYDLDGNPIGGAYDNWQHGFLVVTHNDKQFFVEEVHIDTFNGYQTLFRGKVYQP